MKTLIVISLIGLFILINIVNIPIIIETNKDQSNPEQFHGTLDK